MALLNSPKVIDLEKATEKALRLASQAAGWVLLAAVLYLTLGPVAERPQLGHPQLERAAAWALVGAAFAVGSPRRPWLVFCGVVMAAALSEALQLFAPHRDAHLADAVAKVVGAAAGAGGSIAVEALLQRRTRDRSLPS